MTRAFVIASFAGLAITSAPAAAQHALGDGTALDANQQAGAGRINRPGPSIQDELRFRNAIVTGNAPGGLSFRGDVGYSAPFEFRGELGSDTLFRFRRDSFYSGLAGMGIRGTEALQYQFALTTGNEPPPNLRGSLVASRSGMEPTGFTPYQAPDFASPGDDTGLGDPGRGAGRVDSSVDFGTVDEASPLADPRGQALWTLRSAAAYDAERRFDPSMLTILSADDGQSYGLTASPLRSVTIEALQERRRETQERGQRGDEPADPAAQERFDSFLPAARVETYLSAREPLAAPGGLAGDEGAGEGEADERHITDWQRMRDEIVAHLRAAEQEQAQPPRGLGEPAGPGRDDPLVARREMLERLLDDETVRALQEAPGEYENLWRPSARDFDAYTTHMRTGESLLAEGRYFEAEERFTRALAVEPGDPLAAAGRVHAEIGAGLFVSAAMNLRELLTSNPEIIGARYQANLLPRKERLGAVMLRLRANMERNPHSALARQSALVLAYLGFQSDDRAAMTDGLRQLEASGDTALAGVLGRIWQRRPGGEGEGEGENEGDDQP